MSFQLRRMAGLLGPVMLIAALTPAPAALAAPNQATGASRLAAGSHIEGELKGGEVRIFEIELSAGTFFAASIDQQGIDIHPVVLGPDGEKLFENDAREWGIEPVRFVAPATGTYRLEARTLVQDAPAGHYALQVEAVRPATPDDEAEWRVMRIQLEGYQSILTGEHDRIAQARGSYQRALAGWRSQGNQMREADALTALGFISSWLDEFSQAEQYHLAELDLRRTLGDEYGEARALYSAGVYRRVTGDTAGAQEFFEQSLALHRAAGRHVNEVDLLSALAQSERQAGNYGAALEYSYDAVALARRMAAPAREANALLAAAANHLDLGELDVALALYTRARALAPDDQRIAGTADTQTGLVQLRLGQLDEAQRSLDHALAFWSKRQWGGFLSNTWRYYGQLHLARGDLERALDAFEHSAEVAAKTGFAAGEAAARREAAEALVDLGRLDAASRAYDQAAGRLARPFDPLQESAIVAGQARIAMVGGDLAGAESRADRAVALLESARGRAESARVRTGLFASSHDVYELMVDVLMARHRASPAAGFDRRALEVSERARARSLLEQIAAVRVASGEAGGGPLAELQAVGRRLNAKAEALADARRAGKPALELMLARQVDELVNEHEVTESRLRRDAGDALAIAIPEALTADAVQRLLDPGTVLVEYMLGRDRSYAWAVSRDAIRAYQLDGRVALTGAAGAIRAALAAPPGTAGTGWREALVAPSRVLLAPFAAIPPGTRIVIVAPGELQQVPWAAALVDGAAATLARHELVVAPSASVVAALRRRAPRRSAARRTALVFADPVFEPDDPRVGGAAAVALSSLPLAEPLRPERGALAAATVHGRGLSRLPFTRLEAESIAALAPAGSVRKATGFDATLQAAVNPAVARYRIVHFATHGVLDTRTPELSGLVLSLVDRRGRPQNGFLRLHELANLHLAADLTVLSGCETALGRTVEGEGVIGLTRGFLAAGSNRVVASVWKVDDLATAELMKRFYTEMFRNGRSAPAALRAAQLQMSRSPRWSHPHYWAGWILNGEWR